MTEAHDANLIVHNGKLTTLDRSNPVATAIAVKDGLILATGDGPDVMVHRGAQTRMINASGR